MRITRIEAEPGAHPLDAGWLITFGSAWYSIRWSKEQAESAGWVLYFLMFLGLLLAWLLTL